MGIKYDRPIHNNASRAGFTVRLRSGKYNARKTWYGDRLFDSQLEANYAAELDILVRARVVSKWEPQVKMPIVVLGKKVCDYYIDFVVYYADGRVDYVEVKGHETDVWKLKWKLFEVLYPDLTKTIVK